MNKQTLKENVIRLQPLVGQTIKTVTIDPVDGNLLRIQCEGGQAFTFRLDRPTFIEVVPVNPVPPPTEVVWMRVGDEDGYHPFDTIEDAAQYLGDLDEVPKVTRYEGNAGYGVTAPGYEGQNYISLYFGTPELSPDNKYLAKFIRPLTDDELSEFNESLDGIASAPRD